MEDIKKRPLNEEELEQVAGGARYSRNADGFIGWECSHCMQLFPTLEEAEEHEKTCPHRGRSDKLGLLKPIIL